MAQASPLQHLTDVHSEAGETRARMFQMIFAHAISQIVHTAARVHLADHLAAGPLSINEFCRREGLDPPATVRWLRACIGADLVSLAKDGRIASTPLLDTLQAGAPGSLRGSALSQAGPSHYLPWGRLHDAVRTGAPQSATTLGSDFFRYLANNPGEAAAFDATMGAISAQNDAEIARVLDASSNSLAVDVGGAGGSLIRSVLSANPNLCGILLDLPHVISDASPGDRLDLAAGDYLAEVPPADLYLLRWVLHDWDDHTCERILGNCRSAIAPNGKLVIIESIMDERTVPLPQALLDLTMLVVAGGRERTLDEFDRLLSATGFRRTAMPEVDGLVKVIEAVPV
jgi:hypothetical protein